jgi:hypothetical protein
MKQAWCIARVKSVKSTFWLLAPKSSYVPHRDVPAVPGRHPSLYSEGINLIEEIPAAGVL